MSRVSAAILAAAVVATAGSAYALSGAERPSPASAAAAQQVPTTEATLACPESPQTKHTDTSLLAVTPEPPDTSGDATAVDGSTTVRTLGDLSAPTETESQAGVPLVRPLRVGAQPSVVVGATAAMSAGATAFQWSLEDGKNHSGRAVSGCGAASDDWWFNGADTAVGSTSRLVLTNTTPAITVVDVDIFGPKGSVTTLGQRGIALAPESRQSVDLAKFAPDLGAVTVHVHATAGLVTAAVETSQVDGVTPVGTEWLPPSAEPSTDVVIDAALDGSSSQDLQIANPSDASALVQVQVVDDSGPFVPSGLDAVRVAPDSVKTLPLGKISHNAPVAVRLTSPTPVTGAIVSTAKGGGDYAVSAPSPALTDTAVIPVVPDVGLALEFTGRSQQSSGQFEVTGIDRRGAAVFSSGVTVDGLRTAEWTPPKKKAADAVYLVVSVSLETDIQAIAQYGDKDGVAAVPIVSGVFTVTRPSVTPAR
jgi:hypothetical protein